MATATKTSTTFERETCSRCGGSGHYSRCAQYGTTCFRCRGKGVTLTKRGEATSNYMRSLMQRAAKDLVVGDRIAHSDFATGRRQIELIKSIEVAGDGYLNIETDRTFLGLCPDSLVTMALSSDEHSALLSLALEYQDSLTKAGTPRKR